MGDRPLLHDLTENNDLSGIKQHLNKLRELIPAYAHVAIQKNCKIVYKTRGHHDIVMYFVEEMGVHINEGGLAPLVAAIVSGNEDLAYFQNQKEDLRASWQAVCC